MSDIKKLFFSLANEEPIRIWFTTDLIYQAHKMKEEPYRSSLWYEADGSSTQKVPIGGLGTVPLSTFFGKKAKEKKNVPKGDYSQPNYKISTGTDLLSSALNDLEGITVVTQFIPLGAATSEMKERYIEERMDALENLANIVDEKSTQIILEGLSDEMEFIEGLEEYYSSSFNNIKEYLSGKFVKQLTKMPLIGSQFSENVVRFLDQFMIENVGYQIIMNESFSLEAELREEIPILNESKNFKLAEEMSRIKNFLAEVHEYAMKLYSISTPIMNSVLNRNAYAFEDSLENIMTYRKGIVAFSLGMAAIPPGNTNQDKAYTNVKIFDKY